MTAKQRKEQLQECANELKKYGINVTVKITVDGLDDGAECEYDNEWFGLEINGKPGYSLCSPECLLDVISGMITASEILAK